MYVDFSETDPAIQIRIRTSENYGIWGSKALIIDVWSLSATAIICCTLKFAMVRIITTTDLCDPEWLCVYPNSSVTVFRSSSSTSDTQGEHINERPSKMASLSGHSFIYEALFGPLVTVVRALIKRIRITRGQAWNTVNVERDFHSCQWGGRFTAWERDLG